MPDLPVFGERLPGVSYRHRPGAYLLVRDGGGRFAVVETPQGRYLPGGGLNPGELPEDAARRELLEECGARVNDLRFLSVALQYCVSKEGAFAKVCYFFRAVGFEVVSAAVEADHQLLWLSPEEAGLALLHESHAWAIAECGIGDGCE